MSNEDQNVTALRQAYRRWADSKGKDQSGWLAIVGDDLTLRSLADGAPGMEFSSQRRGKLELLDYLNGLTADWDMIFYSYCVRSGVDVAACDGGSRSTDIAPGF